jgi:predicted AAA+ superfamily ATPase
MSNRILGKKLAASRHSCFLWGPSQTGKSYLLRENFPSAAYYDLRSVLEFRRLRANPSLFADECAAMPGGTSGAKTLVIVDEIQKLPELLDEVHKLISLGKHRFILTGSSPRKLMRGVGSLLGGRVLRNDLYPLTSAEVPDFSLERALNQGLLPPHYLEDTPAVAAEMLRAYTGQYLREEILAEALVRNVAAFQRFLEVAALTNGQIVNNATIARECGVSAVTVASYFQILTDTLLGVWVPAWTKRAKRRVIGSPRFYFFDIGLVNELLHRQSLAAGSPEFGANFEHFLFMELRAYLGYAGRENALSWWRTTSGAEVDFILGDNEIALEVKSSERITSDHLKGLRSHREEFKPRRSLLVSRVARARKTEDGIEILPWKEFLKALWAGDVF